MKSMPGTRFAVWNAICSVSAKKLATETNQLGVEVAEVAGLQQRIVVIPSWMKNTGKLLPTRS